MTSDHPQKALEDYCRGDMAIVESFRALDKYRREHPKIAMTFIACGEYFSRLVPWARIYALHLAETTRDSLEQAARTVLFYQANFSEIEERIEERIKQEFGPLEGNIETE